MIWRLTGFEPAVDVGGVTGERDNLNPSLAATGSAVFITWEDDTEYPGVPEIYFDLAG